VLKKGGIMGKQIAIKTGKQLGAELKKRRKDIGITQMELAKFCNLSHTGIGRIESAQNDVKFETLLKLSKFLGIKITIELED
tara:strand:+ start:286363 stop:286608 length:246 start_codon:yes stop_codon:yes gene_type:complete